LPAVPLDEGLSEQAFINIVQNAYDAMGERGGLLRVGVVTSRTEGRDGVEVRIADSGPGIPQELREQIFNPFVTTKKTGVGLGLSIVSKIMDGHNGFIRIENTKQAQGNNETGACFVLFFPAVAKTATRETSPLVVS
jgi:signal transduction histidine kinase